MQRAVSLPSAVNPFAPMKQSRPFHFKFRAVPIRRRRPAEMDGRPWELFPGSLTLCRHLSHHSLPPSHHYFQRRFLSQFPNIALFLGKQAMY